MNKPQIIFPENGVHNAHLGKTIDRLIKGDTYRDLSTVCIIPTRGKVHVTVLQSWLGMIPAPNQKFVRIFGSNMEVGDSYNVMIDAILSNPELSKWKYILTLEEDNTPPPDGLMKLYESIE